MTVRLKRFPSTMPPEATAARLAALCAHKAIAFGMTVETAIEEMAAALEVGAFPDLLHLASLLRAAEVTR